MSSALFLAACAWNRMLYRAGRQRILSGAGIHLSRTADGVAISTANTATTRRPWQMSPQWVVDEDLQPAGGCWGITVYPGFVNGRDVTLPTVIDGETVHRPLTDEQAPVMRLTRFRNPAAAQGIETTTDLGDIRVLPAEGYPPFFERLGVVPPSKGGLLESILDDSRDAQRNRQLAACDIILATPRAGASQQVTVSDTFAEGVTLQVASTYNFGALERAPSRHWLRSDAKWSPPQQPSMLERMLGVGIEPETDELLIGTLYLVSPPYADPDAVPDATWTPYTQHRVFKNLNHASRGVIGPTNPRPLVVRTGLLNGAADLIFSTLLDPVNQGFEALSTYLNASDFTGRYWTI